VTTESRAGDRGVGGAVARAAAVIALVVALLGAWYARDVLLLAFAGVLLAVFLRTIASWVSARTPLPTGLALAAVVVLLFGGLVTAFWLRGPAIAVEVDALRDAIPRAASAAEARLRQYAWGREVLADLPTLEEALPSARSAVSRATGAFSRTFGVLMNFVVILFLGVAFAATPRPYVRGILALVPAPKEPRAREVLDRLGQTLWWWLVGRVLSMAVIGVATGVGLWLLGVPLAFLLALIAALLTFIPNVGPVLSAVPAILLALVQGPRVALYVVLLYAGVQLVESYVLAPVIDQKTVYLPPALSVLAQLVLALAAGLLGVALAAPLAAAAMVVVTLLYVQDVLGRRDVDVRTH
jgi:predicted PurR-regulated permease PerM